jgi:hypothetical protein
VVGYDSLRWPSSGGGRVLGVRAYSSKIKIYNTKNKLKATNFILVESHLVKDLGGKVTTRYYCPDPSRYLATPISLSNIVSIAPAVNIGLSRVLDIVLSYYPAIYFLFLLL